MEQSLKPQLVMERGLETLPESDVPPGYRIRSFQAGDEAAWERIIGESFNRAYRFNEYMENDRHFRPERVLFVVREDEPVATASAWYGDEQTGCLHMVGVLSSHAGQGLGLQVSLAAMRQMVREGRTQVTLLTDDFRIAAIKTYLKLGFKPKIVHENQPERWKTLSDKLGTEYKL